MNFGFLFLNMVCPLMCVIGLCVYVHLSGGGWVGGGGGWWWWVVLDI